MVLNVSKKDMKEMKIAIKMHSHSEKENTSHALPLIKKRPMIFVFKV